MTKGSIRPRSAPGVRRLAADPPLRKDSFLPDHNKPRGVRWGSIGVISPHKFAVISVLTIVAFAVTYHRGLVVSRKEKDCPIQDWNYPKCWNYLRKVSTNNEKSSATTQNVTAATMWPRFRSLYQEIIGDDKSTLDPISWKDPHTSGFRVAVNVRQSPGKGMGVFLAQEVKKGEIVWENRVEARFPDECAVRRFLARLSDYEQCKVIEWATVRPYSNTFQFVLDMDDSAYLNEPRRIGQSSNLLVRHSNHDEVIFVAKLDMKAGTELLVRYSNIHSYFRLFWFEKLCLKSRGLIGWVSM